MLFTLGIAPLAHAGTVKHGLSGTESWVGAPITLTIQFENPASHDAPEIPAIEGLEISSLGGPDRASQVSIINGRRTESHTLTYRWHLNASRPGQYLIPGIELLADGQQFVTEPEVLTFIASEDDRLLEAEIIHVPDTAWVGDVLDATLCIRVKPYRDSKLQSGVLSASEMWKLIDPDNSMWGPFRSSIVELIESGALPSMRIDDRAGPNGDERWYAFDIQSRIPLTKSGQLNFSNVMINMSYPTAIGNSRRSRFDIFGGNPFGSGLEITQTRPVTASPESARTLIQTPPMEGRPSSWTGAVGRFTIDVSATPTDVVVGEPITLTMKITDSSQPPADLDVLEPPNLTMDPGLADSFRIPDDHPGGVVSGRTKTFTQTIRPTSTASTLITPIEFSFFDPKTSSYDIAYSRPIDLTVSSARTLSATDLGGTTSAPALADQETVTPVSGGLLANYADPDVLLRPAASPNAYWMTAAFLAPPVCYGILTGFRTRRDHAERHPARARARRARRMFQEALANADSPDAKALAFRTYVADRLGLPRTIAGGEALNAVRTYAGNGLAEQCATELQRLERAAYAGNAPLADERDGTSLSQLVDDIEEALR